MSYGIIGGAFPDDTPYQWPDIWARFVAAQGWAWQGQNISGPDWEQWLQFLSIELSLTTGSGGTQAGEVNVSWVDTIGGYLDEFEDISDLVTGGGSGTARDQAVALVNSAEVILQSNYTQYMNGNMTAGTCASKFDAVWTQLVTKLQTLGTEGSRAIADRQGGGKFDWFAAYRPSGVAVTTGTPSTGTVLNGGTTQAGILGATVDSKTLLIMMGVGLLAFVLYRKGALA